MRMDAGLADEYWKQYYTPDEVDEILASRTTTTFISDHYPIHVGMHVRDPHAPTVLMAHGLYVYGLTLARLQLPFFRAGFNVVAWDLPGMGQSGGPRGGCTVLEYVRAWHDAVDFACARFTGPLFAMGVAEDAISCYHALANDPRVRRLSLHTLMQLGDYESMHWHGPAWWMRLLGAGLPLVSAARPSTTRPSETLVPLEWIFTGPGDEWVIQLLRHDPLGFKRVTLAMVSVLSQRVPAPVPFEACRTPVQVIASDSNRIWRYDAVVSNYHRLAGKKQLVTLAGGQWEYNREFQEDYAAHAIEWFATDACEKRP